MLAGEMRVAQDNVGLIGLEERSGTRDVVGKFHVYGSLDSKKKVHPRYMDLRLLTKQEREKLKQEVKDKKTKKSAAPAAPAAPAAAEAKK
jgi:ribosomal protein S24E